MLFAASFKCYFTNLTDSTLLLKKWAVLESVVFFYYYFTHLRVFRPTTGGRMIASLLKSPGLALVF